MKEQPAKKRAAKKRSTKKRTAKKKGPAKPASRKKAARKQPTRKKTTRTKEATTVEPAQSSNINPPAWLPADAAEHWPLVIQQLQERDKLEMTTPQHVAIYCRTLARYLDAMDKVEKKGFTVATERGEFVSPETQIALKLIDHLRHLAKDLGLNEPAVGYQNALQQLGFRLQEKQTAGLN